MRKICILLSTIITLTGCVYHHRVTYKLPIRDTLPISSKKNIDLKVDAYLDRKENWFWLPPALIIDWDKKEFKFGVSFYGEGYKNYNGKFYFREIELKENDISIFKSSNTNLFAQDTFYFYHYKTDYFLKLNKPFKRNLVLKLKFDLVRLDGTIDSFNISSHLDRQNDEGFSWFMGSP